MLPEGIQLVFCLFSGLNVKLGSSHQACAFWNICNHGEAANCPGPSTHSLGVHGHCHIPAVSLSGWGIIAICLPSELHNPTMPSGDPFGLNGYTSVDSPSSST